MTKMTKTHLFSVHHFGHTRLELLVSYEVGIDLAMQASERLSTIGQWKREMSGHTGLTQHMGSYFDIYVDGAITLRPLNVDNENALKND